MKPTGNPNGRPKGTRPLNNRAIVATLNRSLMPFSEELIQRGVERAMEGDGTALMAMLELLGRALAVSSPAAKPQAAAA